MTAGGSTSRTIRTGQCDECMATFAVWPHWERENDVPPVEQWEGNLRYCPVCDDGRLDWDWSDPLGETFRTGYVEAEEDQS